MPAEVIASKIVRSVTLTVHLVEDAHDTDAIAPHSYRVVVAHEDGSLRTTEPTISLAVADCRFDEVTQMRAMEWHDIPVLNAVSKIDASAVS